MAFEEILSTVKKFIDTVRQQGISIEAAYLFGSWADGRADEWSDIDLAIVSPAFDGVTFYDRRKLDKAVVTVDVGIEPHPYRPEDFTEADWFVREIIRTGIRIV